MDGKVVFSIGPHEEKPKRENKGKSRIDFPDEYVVVDIETTGLSPEYDSIIEVAAIKISGGNCIDSFSSLIKPEENYIDEDDEDITEDFVINADGEKVYYIDDFISELTGITNKMLYSAETIEKVLPRFKTFISSDIIVGHNVNFDINFLYDNFVETFKTPLENDFVDTMRIAKKLLSKLEHHRLSDIAEYYFIDCSGIHRSLADCEITYKVFCLLQNEIIMKYNSLEIFSEYWKSKSYSLKAKDIQSTISDIDTTHPLYGNRFVFTGTLEKMVRKEAMQIVANFGGINEDNVTAKTNYLILGNNDYCFTIKGGKSIKHKKAESLKLKGNDIAIIPENVFYDMVLQ